MTAFIYHYRRRHLDRTVAIDIASGPLRFHRDDGDGLIVDLLLQRPRAHGDAAGRRNNGTSVIQRPLTAAARLWLWRRRPMRLMQMFDAEGVCAYHRIDFASAPWRRGPVCYQTDLYLDLFAKSDGSDYAIQDEDELALAVERGLLNASMRDRVLHECAALTASLEQGRYLESLGPLAEQPFDYAPRPDAFRWTHRNFRVGQRYRWPRGAG